MPVQPIKEDMYGNAVLTPIKTVIEAVTGDKAFNYLSSKSNIIENLKNNLQCNEEQILLKINERNKARESKNYKLADQIRNQLLDKGVLIEDTDGKTTWKFK